MCLVVIAAVRRLEMSRSDQSSQIGPMLASHQKHYPDQAGDATSCGPMTLMALNYEGDGLQPNFSKENCQEGGVFRPRITHDLDRGRVDSVWEAQRTGR